MNRIFLATGAIFTALAIAFAGYFTVISTCDTIEKQMEKICILARNEDVEKAKVEADLSIEIWEKEHGKIEAFVPHSVTDSLEEVIKSLPVYARQDNMERLEQQADLAIDEIHHLIRSEKPLLSNIF